MDRLCKPEQCTGCGACAAVCPVGCIRMENNPEGFLQPLLDSEKCISCGKCQKTCPVLSENQPKAAETVAYAAINTDEQVRNDSTSGGIFTLLCRWVLEHRGIVFGAAYDEDFQVVHCAVEKPEELWRLRGAKYAQSNLGDTYHRVRTCLEEGRYVLFSGTPCQVGGLVSFLEKDYDYLILVDLICHGVPSPKVWSHYISCRSGLDAGGQKPSWINLRSKESGWPGYSIRFDYPGGQNYSALNSRDPYLRGFVGNLYLRSSCYDCRFKGIVRQSDVTLGDYWGVWGQLPELHDGKGTSLVLLHTRKAKQLWEELGCQMRHAQVEPSAALTDNPSAVCSSAKTDRRESFFGRYEQEDFQTLIDELCPKPKAPAKKSFARRVVSKLRRVLGSGK